MNDLLEDLEAVARFSAGGPGITRIAWSPELLGAYDWLAGRGAEIGLTSERDPAGNLMLRWEAGEGRAVLVGSHLDSVRNGGRYDGTLGVLAGLHALRLLRGWGVAPRRPVWLASWMDEEGARFGTALMGSRAFAGEDVAAVMRRRDPEGVTVAEAMEAVGADPAEVGRARGIDRVGAYLEMHVEQGPVLEDAGADLGLVTAIVGLVGFRVRYVGEANHAGTTPMERRRDALAGAARAVLALREEARRRADLVANVGIIRAEPGGFNVVPGACEFTIDVRSPSPAGLAAAEGFVASMLSGIAEEEGLGLDLAESYRLPAVPMDEALVDLLERAAREEGVEPMRMPSGAGHDAMVIAPHVPAGMLFVPSRGGISHSPEEHTDPEHCELGARVLARALRALVERDR